MSPAARVPKARDGAAALQEKGSGKEVDSTPPSRSQVLEGLQLAPGAVEATQAAWNAFLERYPSQEAAGEAIYSAAFDAAPGLQALFKTPKAIQAVKFVVGMTELIAELGNKDRLQAVLESVGFRHLHLVEATGQRVTAFTEAIVRLVQVELGEAFNQVAREGLSQVMHGVGEAIIFIRSFYAERLRILSDSWRLVHHKKSSEHQFTREDSGTSTTASSQPTPAHNKDKATGSTAASGQSHSRKSGFRALVGNIAPMGKERGGEEQRKATSGSGELLGAEEGGLMMTQHVPPTTFEEMFEVNAVVMGFQRSKDTWMPDVLQSFDVLVTHVSDSKRLQEESEVLALHLSKYQEGIVNLTQFKSCMLATLRSLLPKSWTTAHEEAWSWMWDNVARLLERNMGSPLKYEKALEAHFNGVNEQELFEMRMAIYRRFFEVAPAGQDYFKQSTTRLHFIADSITKMTVEIFKSPRRMVSDISALGLRHVGYGVPTDLFGPFVSACVDVMQELTKDQVCLEAYRWSLALIAKILVRTITEGSTVVMRAINKNSPKLLRKALASTPRGARAAALLDVQVGDQHISPLSWALESGSLKVTHAIIRDILTIRADRGRYYYGVEELFARHGDIVKRLCEEAPLLLPTLLDGLIWRSHRPVKGMRRVNYYLQHMLINADGGFADALKYIAGTGDPGIVSHPVVAQMVEMLWSGVVLRQFIYSRMFNMGSLVLFVLSQEILPGLDTEEGNSYIRWAMLLGRLFTYIIVMFALAFSHTRRVWMWCRTAWRRIIEEIDTDGNGTIDYEEMVEAMGKFRDTVKEEIKKALRVLRDDDGPGTTEEARKAIANKEKNAHNMISFTLMVLLALMCVQEPMFWCSGADNWPTAICDDNEAMRYRYSIFAMVAMAVHWLALIDMAVFNTDISAFLLVCGHVLSEVKQFLTALCFLLMMFGSAMSIMCRDCVEGGGNFNDMLNAIVTLFSITVGLYQGDYRDIQENPMLLGFVFLFVTLSVVLLMNLLIAQLNRSYEYIYQDMLGFARLNRASLIVDAMSSCPRGRWLKFVESCRFAERLEFDEGDLGLPGGMQIQEPATLHRQVAESILRFGGNTSPALPWPEPKAALEGEEFEDRLERVELFVQKALQRFSSIDPAAHRGDVNRSSLTSASRSASSEGEGD